MRRASYEKLLLFVRVLCYHPSMDDSDLLGFDPVPVRARRDGWTVRRQYFFILALARGYTPGKAAALVGMSRKTAYELRARPDAQGFAAAWDAALARARARRMAARAPSLSERARHGAWHPRLHQGRLVGWEHRPDNARAMGILKRLDRRIERLPPETDVRDYDRYLASLDPERDSPDSDRGIERRDCHVPRRRRA
jgi:hypothetical protein